MQVSTAVGRMLTGVFGRWPNMSARSSMNGPLPPGRLGVPAVSTWGRPKAVTPDQARQVRALHEMGESVPALVATFGVSRATVYRLLAEEALPA